MISGSIPLTANARRRSRGAMPRRAASESRIRTRAAAPSLIPAEFPAVTVPSFANTGLQLREALDRRPGAGVLVAGKRLVCARNRDRHDLRVEVAALDRGHGPLLAQCGERVLPRVRRRSARRQALRSGPSDSPRRVGDDESVPSMSRRSPSRHPSRAPYSETAAAHRLVAAAATTSAWPVSSSCAPLTIAWSPEEQSRLTFIAVAPTSPGGHGTTPRVVCVWADLPDLPHDDLVHVTTSTPPRTSASRMQAPRGRARRRP